MNQRLVISKFSGKAHLMVPDESFTLCGVEIFMDREQDESPSWIKTSRGLITCALCINSRTGY